MSDRVGCITKSLFLSHHAVHELISYYSLLMIDSKEAQL